MSLGHRPSKFYLFLILVGTIYYFFHSIPQTGPGWAYLTIVQNVLIEKADKKRIIIIFFHSLIVLKLQHTQS